MRYIVIFNRLAGIPNVAQLVPPMVLFDKIYEQVEHFFFPIIVDVDFELQHDVYNMTA